MDPDFLSEVPLKLTECYSLIKDTGFDNFLYLGLSSILGGAGFYFYDSSKTKKDRRRLESFLDRPFFE